MPRPVSWILSTRPVEAELLGEAAEQGIILDDLSFIETRPVREAELGVKIRELARRSLVAIFTSMNAVEAVADWLRGNPEEKGDSHMDLVPTPWKIFCIGSATRQRVAGAFGEDKIAGTADSAGALAEVILHYASSSPIEELVFFCGDQRRDELPQKLTEGGIPVQELVVYTTLRTPHKLEQAYDGIAFFSPSAVHSFFSVNMTLPEQTLLFAIGQSTADAVGPYTKNQLIVSGTPDKKGLIRLAIEHFKNKP